MFFHCHAQTPSCIPVPNCIERTELYGDDIPSGDMAPWGPVAINGWGISHGSPTVFGGQGVWMWSYMGDTRGEGIYTCYNFVRGNTYRICLEVRCDNLPGTHGYEKGYFFIQASNGNFTRPFPVSNQLVARWRMTDQMFTKYTYTFTANRNYSKLWLFPYMAEPPDGLGSQYSSIVRSVRVEEVKAIPQAILSSDSIKIVNKPIVSGYWSWNNNDKIFSANADSSIIKVQVCSPTLFEGKFITDCGICDTLEVSINKDSDMPMLGISGDNYTCRGNSLILNVAGADNFSWSPGNYIGSSYNINPDTTTTYTIIGTTGVCSSIIKHTVFVNPVYTSISEVELCSGETYILPDSSTIDKAGIYTNSFKSSHGCDSIITSKVTIKPSYIDTVVVVLEDGNSYQLSDGSIIDSSGTYTIISKAINGCDSISIISLTRNVFIPNLLTSNADMHNDKFIIKGIGAYSKLKIYNRWGNLVYENISYDNSWDPEGNAGIYFYELLLPDQRKYTGWLQVIQ